MRAIEKTIEIAAPLEAVWKALVDAEEIARWFPLEARVEPRVGGAVFLSWGPHCQGEARIEAIEAGCRLRWVEPAVQPGASPTVVEWVLEARGGKTLLRLVNSGISSESWADEYYESLNYGWVFMLTNLRHYLERHAGQPRLVAWPRRNVALSREAVWERMLAENGFCDLAALAGAKPGDRASLRAAGDTLQGRVEFLLPPRGFCLRLKGFNDSLLWLSNEGSGEKTEVGFWLSAYAVSPAEIAAFEARWNAGLEKLFP